MNDPAIGKTVRRRRSWYRRRLRIQRALLAASMMLLLVGVCWQTAARLLALPTLHPARLLPDSFWARGDVRGNLSMIAARSGARKIAHVPQIYPYSVIPGGMRDANDLREIAARDYVVARHFAGFNYRRARLVRARIAREVYLSYRLRDRVFWTRKKIHLHADELLLTDGAITARTRCGNQVSEQPKAEVSEEEPAEDVLDQPVVDFGKALPYRSALSKPSLPGAEPLLPHPPELFAGGFFFPYVPFGAPIPSGRCESAAQEKWEQDHGIVDNEKLEKPCKPGHKPPVVPEPASIVLISSGLAVVFWRYRQAGRKSPLATGS